MTTKPKLISLPKINLTQTDPSRSEFGEYRTVCTCRACTISCQWIPGYLIPADLDRWRSVLVSEAELTALLTMKPLQPAQLVEEWALANLLASPGALVVNNGVPFRVPTLVPARQEDGHTCKFLNSQHRCSVHESAPFGCAFFDSHQSIDDAMKFSAKGLEQVIVAWRNNDLYARIWVLLYQAGKIAPGPTESRERMHEAWALETINKKAAQDGKA